MLYNDYLFWGNNKNITYFTSEDVMDEHPVPDKVVITQIEVDNKPVEIGEKINDQVILSEGVPYIHNLTLSGMNNSFSLLFSNLTYSETLQKYSYHLAPYQSEWLISEEGEKVSYTNLPQGEYLFEVKSIFPDGSSGDVTSLVIKILPHWYETVWFRLTVLFFVVLVLYYWMRRVKIQQARLRKEERLKHELFVANLEREKEKQINKERENFFTNVSHELRTPLTLILSPLQELLQTDRLPLTLHEKLSLIYNNASSLSTLVNQLLYVQKIEAGMVQLYLAEVDIVALVKKVMVSFKHMAEIKNTEFILDSGIPIPLSGVLNRDEPFQSPVKTIDLLIGYQPKDTVRCFTYLRYFYITIIGSEVLYIFPVVTAQAVIRTKPHKTVTVFMDTGNGIISQSVLHSKYPNVFLKKSISGSMTEGKQ